MTVLFADTTINHAGLMRCEITTIQQYCFEHAAEHVPSEPLILDCEFEEAGTQNIVLKDGVWGWYHENPVETA